MKAAQRLQEALRRADEGGYGTSGWYSYIDRRWVEEVLSELEYLQGITKQMKPK